MKTYSTTFIILILGLLYSSFKPKTNQFEVDGITIKYEKNQGRFHGDYSSYYPNGKIKSKGSFNNNLRAGVWSVWDSTGRLRISRKYESPFVFTRTFPKVPTDKVIKLLNVPQYAPVHNKARVIEYYPLQERMMVWLIRVWRNIDPKNNDILFKNNNLEKILHKNVFTGTIKAYTPKTDTFKSILKPADIDTTNLKIIRFKIKEETFFDNDRLISETRILGICPVAHNTLTNDTFNLYWVYYPELRYQLAQESLISKEVPSKIGSFCDLFFYRYFYGEIYKVSSIKDETIANYKSQKDISKEALRIDLNTIEKEHNTWIQMSK